MSYFNFTGYQDTDKGRMNMAGHLESLPRDEEFRIPIKGIIMIYDGKKRASSFRGSIVQIVLAVPPSIKLYSDNGLGEKFFYEFTEVKDLRDKLIYEGRYCPINQETARDLAMLFMPKSAREASLEFALETAESRNLMRRIGLLN